LHVDQVVFFLACDFRSCFCRNKALRFLHVFGQEVGLFDVWIIDSTARLKHRSRDGCFVVHSINTQTFLQSCSVRLFRWHKTRTCGFSQIEFIVFRVLRSTLCPLEMSFLTCLHVGMVAC